MSNIERGRANVYADLGYPDAEEMQVKAQLASKIGDIVELHLKETPFRQ